MLKTRDALFTGRINRLYLPPPLPRPAQRKAKTLWYALHFPGLTDPAVMAELASAAQLASARICVTPSNVLVLEVRSMLRYFGGFTPLSRHLLPALRDKLSQLQQPDDISDALSPSAEASALFARTGIQARIHDIEALRSVLGRVPVSSLPLNIKLLQRLENCGLYFLRDIWRLPSTALRLRFGRDLSEYLDLLQANRPSTPHLWQPAITFSETVTVDNELTYRADILWLTAQLLDRMEAFLKPRQLMTDQLIFSLYLHKRLLFSMTLGTRSPANDKALWQALTETRLEQIELIEPVSAIKLEIFQFQPAIASGAYPANTKSHPGTESTLLEILAARLGAEKIFKLHWQASHDPATAGQYLGFQVKKAAEDVHEPDLRHWLPCWLLSKPRALFLYDHKPVYLTPLDIIQGPARVETQWWTGHDIRRDYYVARNGHGMMLWIYRDLDRHTESGKNPSDWFLHGLFP